MPCCAALQALPYVRSSQPQTGSTWSVQACGVGAHTPRPPQLDFWQYSPLWHCVLLVQLPGAQAISVQAAPLLVHVQLLQPSGALNVSPMA